MTFFRWIIFFCPESLIGESGLKTFWLTASILFWCLLANLLSHTVSDFFLFIQICHFLWIYRVFLVNPLQKQAKNAPFFSLTRNSISHVSFRLNESFKFSLKKLKLLQKTETKKLLINSFAYIFFCSVSHQSSCQVFVVLPKEESDTVKSLK